MQYRTLGNTGLKVSEIGFGGEWMDGTLEETIAVTRACEDAGVPIRRVDETKALGAACGLDIPCAAAAILK